MGPYLAGGGLTLASPGAPALAKSSLAAARCQLQPMNSTMLLQAEWQGGAQPSGFPKLAAADSPNL